MNCPSTEELSALYDGLLGRASAKAVRNHIADCPRCAQEFATLHRMLQNAARSVAPAPLLDRARAMARSFREGTASRKHLSAASPKTRSQPRR